MLRLRGWIGTLGCWDGRDEVAEWLSLAGEASPSVVELVGQRRVEHEVRYWFGLGVKRLSCAWLVAHVDCLTTRSAR